ncbi:hypothetical protein Desde_1048 [Desulfitobacterium dehalogenans ATCC 51507]|uniref:Uncharacterized protein n=1 Tax=Desulfitobacterium dehalogenans (strain ATCC 51507 / DSM 9161 / JW/IU-DC1) TaxID=756499 RepID=I4A697_DESDJ|nr:hypothetical protein [Desulfitobacterium dehalogenans]AFL99481.1 hypothetical protein Desde_1048 [Desulfitobacterium dehalogenans ATCC 51507]
MTNNLRQELEQEIELAKMMAADIDKVYKKYAKAALQAQQDRLYKIRAEKYKGYSTEAELHNAYGYGEITIDEYDEGRDFLAALEARESQMSLIEKHRKNLKEIRDNWKGTVIELQRELDELNGEKKEKQPKLNAFERLEQERHTERLAALQLQESLGSVIK